MTFRGHVEWVESTTPRGFLASDQILGATSLPIYGADSFVSSTNAGSVVIDGHTYAYSSVTVSADESVTPSTLVVSPGLVQAEINGEPVELVSADETKFAGVSTGDGIGDVMRVRVPHNLKSYSALTDGVRAAGTQETVDVDRVNGELLVTNVVGVADQFDASTTPIVTSTAGGERVQIDGDGITLYTNDALPLLAFSTVDYPNGGLAVDSSGNSYVGCNDKYVRKFDSTGTLALAFTTSGAPSDLALDGTGNIYISDITTSVIRKFNTSGTQTLSFSTTGTPNAVAVDSSGNIYVADNDNLLIRKFNTSGTQTLSFSIDHGTGGVAVDATGGIYHSNGTSSTVQKYTSAGVLLTTIPIGGTPTWLALDATGNIYVGDFTYQLVRKFTNPTGTVQSVRLDTLLGRLTAYNAVIWGNLDVSTITAPNGLRVLSGGAWPLLDNRITPTLTNGTGTSEIVVAKWTLPANYLTAGQMAEIKLLGQVSSTATLTWKVRCGAAGTTADALLIQFATTAAGAANAHVMLDSVITCLTAGASGTVTAGGVANTASTQVGPRTDAFAAATVDTTQALFLTVTVTQSASQTLTTRSANLSKMRG